MTCCALRLVNMIDVGHEVVKLVTLTDWKWFYNLMVN